VEARDNHSLGSEQTKEGRALIGRRELIDGVIAPSAAMYQNPIVHTHTPLAHLLPVLATAFGSKLSTMIIISTHDPCWRRRGDLIAYRCKAASEHDQ
jgi:hypothetical protein